MSVTVQQTSPVPTNAARFPSGFEHITWAPKKKQKFKPRIFVPPSSDTSDESQKSPIEIEDPNSSPDRSSTPKLPKKGNPVKPKRLKL